MEDRSEIRLGHSTLAAALLVTSLISCSQQGPAEETVPPKVAQTERPRATDTVQVTVPQGTEIHLTLAAGVSSASSQTGDSFTARTTDPVVVGSRVAIPAGSTIRGQVSDVIPAKKG